MLEETHGSDVIDVLLSVAKKSRGERAGGCRVESRWEEISQIAHWSKQHARAIECEWRARVRFCVCR
jgi:hypothetical protein